MFRGTAGQIEGSKPRGKVTACSEKANLSAVGQILLKGYLRKYSEMTWMFKSQNILCSARWSNLCAEKVGSDMRSAWIQISVQFLTV